MATVNLTTENAIVNAVGKMAITGNVIPESWYRTIETEMGKCPNVMYIELISDALYKLTYPEPADENGKTSFPSDKEVFTKKETCPSSEVMTNTKNTTEITTKNTTTARARDVVDQAMEIFAPLRLSKDDIRAIVREAEYDIDRCINAKAEYDAYRTPVGNATGLLISFVRGNYPKIGSVTSEEYYRRM